MKSSYIARLRSVRSKSGPRSWPSMYGARIPADACVAPAATVRASKSRTRAPREASSRAIAQPMIPPPTMMTSAPSRIFLDHTGRGHSIGTVTVECPRHLDVTASRFASSSRFSEVHDRCQEDARRLVDGLPYHVLNRGNRRQRSSRNTSDYEMFLTTLADAIADGTRSRSSRSAVMPNHFHLVLWPQQGIEISAFMRWFMNAHIRRYHRFGELWGTGHLYQGRFKAFPIQTDHHLLTVLRYVEAIRLRARPGSRAEAGSGRA